MKIKSIPFKIFGLVFLFFSQNLICQSIQNLEKEYEKAREMAAKNPDSSLVLLNFIQKNAIEEENGRIEVKCDYLKSYNYYLKSDAQKCIDYAQKAQKNAQKYNYPDGEALALRILGAQNAKLGLLENAQENLNQALKIINTSETKESNEIRGLIYNSFLILFNENDIQKKLHFSKKAIKEFLKITNSKRKNELLSSAYTNLGYNYVSEKKFDSAGLYFNKSLSVLSPTQNYLKSAIFHDIGFSFAQQKKHDSAIFYYQKSLQLVEKYGFSEKKKEILKNLATSYKEKKDTINAEKYELTKLKLEDSLQNNNKTAINNVVKFEKKETKSLLHTKNNFLKIGVIFILLLLPLFYFLWRKYKTQQKKYAEIVAKIKKEGLTDTNISLKEDTEKDLQAKSEPFTISVEVEEKILQELIIFENEGKFNSKTMSLSHLSDQMNVNNKYLSVVIKKHKNMNFNGYINHLRINYLIEKLRTDPEFSKYKISYLAEITGYSSHSAFSAVFQQIVGVSPSVFINELNRQK